MAGGRPDAGLGFGPVQEVARRSWTLPAVTIDLPLEHDGFGLAFTPRRGENQASPGNPRICPRARPSRPSPTPAP